MRVSRGAVQHGPKGADRPAPQTVSQFEGKVRHVPIGEGQGMNVAVVHFYDGARTYLHRHDDGQILIILSGHGQVGTPDAVEDVGTGDVISAAPGELHWHGAAPGQDMTHLSIALGASFWPGEAAPSRTPE